MPELPDVTIYVEALAARLRGATLEQVEWHSPFVLRSVEPPSAALVDRTVRAVERLGKRIVIHFDHDLAAVIHLMIAGRLKWARTAQPAGRQTLASFGFDCGSLQLVENATRKRAAVHVVAGTTGLAAHDRGGLELATADPADFAARLAAERHTLKRALTSPHLFSGIGNAYSDEILHAARLSPLRRTDQLDPPAIARLFDASRTVLDGWVRRLREQFGDRFPTPRQITARRPEFAVHGRYGRPCPVCAARVQRIRYAETETHYCPGCQTAGKVLADRSLSRLWGEDWQRVAGGE